MTRAWLTTALVTAACGGGTPRTANLPDTSPPQPGSTTASPAPAPAVPSGPARQLGHLMVGIWDILPTGIGGPSLSVEITSAGGDTFRGMLTRALVGNVLLDVGRFQPFTGTIGGDSVFAFRIDWREQGPPPTEVSGKAGVDSWRLTRFVWGGEQQVMAGRTWTGRKAK